MRRWQADKKAEAARRKKQKAADEAASTASPETDTTTTTVDTRSGTVSGGSAPAGELRVTQVGDKPKVCGTRTKAGDLIEFRCDQSIISADGQIILLLLEFIIAVEVLGRTGEGEGGGTSVLSRLLLR